jgi:hypothetical protein
MVRWLGSRRLATGVWEQRSCTAKRWNNPHKLDGASRQLLVLTKYLRLILTIVIALDKFKKTIDLTIAGTCAPRMVTRSLKVSLEAAWNGS